MAGVARVGILGIANGPAALHLSLYDESNTDDVRRVGHIRAHVHMVEQRTVGFTFSDVRVRGIGHSGDPISVRYAFEHQGEKTVSTFVNIPPSMHIADLNMVGTGECLLIWCCVDRCA